MATRHIRKLQQLLEPSQSAHAIPTPVESSDDAEEQEASAPFNPFELLTDDEDASGAAKAAGEAVHASEDDAEASAGLSSLDDAAAAPAAASPATASASKAKKKKRKGAKKGPIKVAGSTAVAQGNAVADALQQQQDEDLDAILKELNISYQDTAGAATAAEPQQPSGKSRGSTSSSSKGGAAAAEQQGALLMVDTRSLRGDDELRRIFGADVIEAVDREDDAQHRRARPLPRGMRRRSLKRGALVTPKEHWPPVESGLSMQCVGTVDGKQLFKYVYSPAYQATQQTFQQVQATFDPNNVALLLQQHPYHIDALLTMYELYRHMGEHAFAEETLERALYALEMAWHPWFNPATANCRLNCEVPENRNMFVALFRHLQALSRKGCHRSALECCKLLLAMDPGDPMGALCTVDYLAIRAGRYEWLHRFTREFESDTSLALLPNFAFSGALAALRLEQQQQQKGAASSTASSAGGVKGGNSQADAPTTSSWVTTASPAAPLALRKDQEVLYRDGSGHTSAATIVQVDNSMQPPQYGIRLAGADAVRYTEGSRLTQPPVTAATAATAASSSNGTADGESTGACSGTAQEALLRALLLHPAVVPQLMARLQEKGVGKDGQWASILQRGLFRPPASGQGQAVSASLQHLIAIFVERSYLLWMGADVQAWLKAGCVEAADLAEGRTQLAGVSPHDWRCLAEQSFPADQPNEYGHLRLHDFTDQVNALPREEVQAAMAAGGLPELELEVEAMQRELLAAAEQQMRQRAAQTERQMTDEELRNTNPLMMLLRSMLPWVDAGQQPQYDQDDQQPDQQREQH